MLFLTRRRVSRSTPPGQAYVIRLPRAWAVSAGVEREVAVGYGPGHLLLVAPAKFSDELTRAVRVLERKFGEENVTSPELRGALDALELNDPVRALAGLALDADPVIAAAAIDRILAEKSGGPRTGGAAAGQEDADVSQRPRR